MTARPTQLSGFSYLEHRRAAPRTPPRCTPSHARRRRQGTGRVARRRVAPARLPSVSATAPHATYTPPKVVIGHRHVERHISADSPVAVTSHVTGLSLAPFRNDNPLLRDATGTVQKRDRTPCATPTSVTSRVGVAELLTSHPLLSHRMTRSPRRSTGRRPAPRPAPRGSPRPWSPWSWSWALRSFCGAP